MCPVDADSMDEDLAQFSPVAQSSPHPPLLKEGSAVGTGVQAIAPAPSDVLFKESSHVCDRIPGIQVGRGQPVQ